MPTEALFRDDAYLRSCEARVLSATPEAILLDRTVFYANSGGQPGDVGRLVWDGGETSIRNDFGDLRRPTRLRRRGASRAAKRAP